VVPPNPPVQPAPVPPANAWPDTVDAQKPRAVMALPPSLVTFAPSVAVVVPTAVCVGDVTVGGVAVGGAYIHVSTHSYCVAVARIVSPYSHQSSSDR